MSNEHDSLGDDEPTKTALAEPSFDTDGITHDKPQSDEATDETPTPFVPQLDRYKFIKSLGRGGMGHVWLAYDRQLKRNVALKFMLKAAEEHPTARARFKSESEVLAQLRHDNVVPVYDSGEARGQLYFSMEYLKDKSLHERREEFRTDAAAVVEVIRGVLLGLAHTHQRGVFHRDLKPANVLLRGKVPILSDFGVAKWTEADVSTMSYAVLGTASHMAPEVACGGAKSFLASADVFSVGVMLYSLLSGVLPFVTVQVPNTHVKFPDHRTDPKGVREHPAAVPGVDDELEKVVRKALARDPQFRYESADEMRADLEAWVAGQPVSAPKKTPTKRKWWPWVAVMAVLLLAAGGTMAMAMAMTPRSIAERVKAGERVELVDENGVIRQPLTKVPGFNGGIETIPTQRALSLSSGSTLLATFDTVGIRPPYRLRASVHHEAETDESEAGMVVTHLIHNEKEHAVFGNTFRAVGVPPGRTRLRPAAAFFGPRWVLPANRDSPLDHFGLEPSELAIDPHPVPKGGEPLQFRQIEIVVTASEVLGTHDKFSFDPRQWSEVEKFAKSKFPTDERPTPPRLFGDGVGLLVCNGNALFRSVVIEPLPQP